jgi:lysophospholipase L1-like esterase
MKKLIIIALLLTACGELGDYGKPANDGDTVYYGDSITAYCAPVTLNRAYPGDTSADMLVKVRYFADKDGDANYKILIGINDIIQGIEGGYMGRMNEIFTYLDGHNVEVTGILNTWDSETNKLIADINIRLKELAESYNFTYRDMSEAITADHLYDGVHLAEDGCYILYAR